MCHTLYRLRTMFNFFKSNMSFFLFFLKKINLWKIIYINLILNELNFIFYFLIVLNYYLNFNIKSWDINFAVTTIWRDLIGVFHECQINQVSKWKISTPESLTTSMLLKSTAITGRSRLELSDLESLLLLKLVKLSWLHLERKKWEGFV